MNVSVFCNEKKLFRTHGDYSVNLPRNSLVVHVPLTLGDSVRIDGQYVTEVFDVDRCQDTFTLSFPSPPEHEWE